MEANIISAISKEYEGLKDLKKDQIQESRRDELKKEFYQILLRAKLTRDITDSSVSGLSGMKKDLEARLNATIKQWEQWEKDLDSLGDTKSLKKELDKIKKEIRRIEKGAENRGQRKEKIKEAEKKVKPLLGKLSEEEQELAADPNGLRALIKETQKQAKGSPFSAIFKMWDRLNKPVIDLSNQVDGLQELQKALETEWAQNDKNAPDPDKLEKTQTELKRLNKHVKELEKVRSAAQKSFRKMIESLPSHKEEAGLSKKLEILKELQRWKKELSKFEKGMAPGGNGEEKKSISALKTENEKIGKKVEEMKKKEEDLNFRKSLSIEPRALAKRLESVEESIDGQKKDLSDARKLYNAVKKKYDSLFGEKTTVEQLDKDVAEVLGLENALVNLKMAQDRVNGKGYLQVNEKDYPLLAKTFQAVFSELPFPLLLTRSIQLLNYLVDLQAVSGDDKWAEKELQKIFEPLGLDWVGFWKSPRFADQLSLLSMGLSNLAGGLDPKPALKKIDGLLSQKNRRGKKALGSLGNGPVFREEKVLRHYIGEITNELRTHLEELKANEKLSADDYNSLSKNLSFELTLALIEGGKRGKEAFQFLSLDPANKDLHKLLEKYFEMGGD